MKLKTREDLRIFEYAFHDLIVRLCSDPLDCNPSPEEHILMCHMNHLKRTLSRLSDLEGEDAAHISVEFEGLLESLIPGIAEEMFFAGMQAADHLSSRKTETLQKIRDVLDDDSLDDKECFMKIEKIVCLFESIGLNGGSRHDFG